MATPEPTLLTLADIARVAGFSPQAVSNWRRRMSTFPSPVSKSATGPLFDEQEVMRWLDENGKLTTGDKKDQSSLGRDWTTKAPLTEDERYAVTVLVVPALAALKPDVLAGALADADMRRTVMESVDAAADRVGLFGEALHRVHEAIRSVPDVVLAKVAEQILERDLPAADLSAVDDLMRTSHTMPLSATPEVLRQIMVDLASPRGRVLDPCAGSGSLLAAAASTARPHLLAVAGADIDPVQAVATDLRLQAISTQPEVRWTDVLRQDPFKDLQFDTILIDPPLGRRFRGPSAGVAGTDVASGERREIGDWHWDIDWLEYAAAHLAPGGTAVVLTARHLLTRGGGEGCVRDRLLADGVIDSIVTLPSLSRAVPLPVVVWTLHRGAQPSRTVTLVDARDGRRQWHADYIDFAGRLVEVKVRARGGEPTFDGPITAVRVDIARLTTEAAPLLPSYWIARESRPTGAEIAEQFTDAMRVLGDARTHMSSLSTAASLEIQQVPVEFASLADLRRSGRIDQYGGIRRARDSMNTGQTQVIQGQHLRTWDDEDTPRVHVDGAQGRQTLPGDVLFKADGDPLAIVDHEGGHLIESPLIGFTLAAEEDRTSPELLAQWLSSPEVASLATGSTLRRVDPRHIQIPLFPPHIATALTRILQDLNIQVAAADALAEALRQIRSSTVSAASAGLVPQPVDPTEHRSAH